MKKLVCVLLSLALLVGCLPLALADDAGALSAEEFGEWVRALLSQTVGVSAINAPVGEDALTDDGYAFIYEHTTLYYDKPVLDESSRLQAAALTDGELSAPRGIRVGDTLQDLIALYGWLNPSLTEQNGVIPLYVQDSLPANACWAWAQADGDSVTSLQCAVHALVSDGVYTDAGVVYTLEDGVITGVRAYGVSATTDLQAVQSNLTVVRGDALAGAAEPAAQPYAFAANGAEAFAVADLAFAGLNYLTLTEQTAQAALGEPTSEEWVEDDTGDWLHITERDGLTITHVQDPLRTRSWPDSVYITSANVPGPRGVTVGMTLEQVTALFACDGANTQLGNAILLYGDGDLPPYGLCEPTGDGAVLRYAVEVASGIGRKTVICLRMVFHEDALADINVFTLY